MFTVGGWVSLSVGMYMWTPWCHGHRMEAALRPQCTLQPLRPTGSIYSSPAAPKIRPRKQGSFHLVRRKGLRKPRHWQ